MAPEPAMASPNNAAPAQRPTAFTPSAPSATTPTLPPPHPRPTSATHMHPLQLRPLRPAPYQLPHPAVFQQNRQLFTPTQPLITNNNINNNLPALQLPTTHSPTTATDITTQDPIYRTWPPFQILAFFNLTFRIPPAPLDSPMARELLSTPLAQMDEGLRMEHELRVVALEGWWERWRRGHQIGGMEEAMGEKKLWEVVRDVFGENEFDAL
ncbi:MAG: hypothetical protein L6R37_004432 [Teloschistes peruensis]|nr:MAG: hypothetical protein L6R37_004432 [Teloschistes peruensis]